MSEQKATELAAKQVEALKSLQEAPAVHGVFVTVEDGSNLSIKVEGMDMIHSIVVLQTAIGMISQRIQQQSQIQVPDKNAIAAVKRDFLTRGRA